MKKLLPIVLGAALVFAQGAYADSPTDAPATAPTTTAPASQTSLLKKIVNLLNGTVATSDTATTAINTATGAQSDTAWGGSGSGSVIAILKAIYAKVAATLTVTISGTPSVNQGTSPWVTQPNSNGPVTPGTVASTSNLDGCQYNSSAPSLTTGQQVAVQCDPNGNLKVVGGLPPGTAASNIFAAPIMKEASGNLVLPITCDNFTPFADSSSGSKQLVALSSGKTVYICGYNMVASGTVSVKLLYGTGTNCGTGSTDMTDAYDLTAQNGIVDHPGEYNGLKTAVSNALCVNLSAAVKVAGGVYWTQF